MFLGGHLWLLLGEALCLFVDQGLCLFFTGDLCMLFDVGLFVGTMLLGGILGLHKLLFCGGIGLHWCGCSAMQAESIIRPTFLFFKTACPHWLSNDSTFSFSFFLVDRLPKQTQQVLLLA